MPTTVLRDSYERELITMILGDKCGNKEFIIKSLSVNMFVNRFYKQIFEIYEHLFKAGKEINVFSVCEFLIEEEQQKALKQLYSEFITNVNYKFYIEKIHESYFNSLIEGAKTVKESEEIQKEIDRWQDTTSLVDIGNGAENLICEYYDSWETAIKTGYPSIDAKLGSFQGGDFIILAGSTSMGKTCMMLNLIKSIAKQGKKVDVFSLEMSLSQLQNRIICSEVGINAGKFRDFSMDAREREAYMEYSNAGFKNLPIKVCTDYNITVDKIRKIVKKSESDIVFIDYMGLISGGSNKGSYERLGDISRGLKLLALETNKPFFVLHQLNRSVFDRDDKRPRISDLRDSGKIEQDADAICFVHRPSYFDPAQPEEKLEFIIAKNRHNASNQVVDLVYNKYFQKISDYTDIKKYIA
jgi:replicative DNA helicase